MRRRSSTLRVAAVALAVSAAVTACSATVIDGHGSPARPTSGGSGTNPPGTSPSTTSPSQEPTQTPAQFRDCSKAFNLAAFPKRLRGHLSFECAGVGVPLNYSDPSARQIQLVMVKIHYDGNTSSEGDLVVNPGGPGGAAVEFAAGLVTELPDTVLRHYDIVGFDPRGVGFSTPVRCLSDHQKDDLNASSPVVTTRAGFALAKRNARTFAQACETKYGASLAYFNTVNTARDMDQVRQALGEPKLSYLGFSYGTELGSVYAHLFPGRIRVAVLDGAVDPTIRSVRSATVQLAGFERAFGQFAAWCRRHKPCSSLRSASATVEQIYARARRHPLPSGDPSDPRHITPNLAATGVEGALYAQSQWPTLATALIRAKRGQGGGLLALADSYNERTHGHYSNIADANTTINCNDSRPGPSDSVVRATAKKWTRRYPLFGPSFAIGLFTCQNWQAQRTVPPLPTARTTAEKVLVIGNLHDPATPYRGAVDLTRVMGNAELLSWNGQGHTSYLQGSSCVDGYVDAYLVHQAFPPAHTTCPAK